MRTSLLAACCALLLGACAGTMVGTPPELPGNVDRTTDISFGSHDLQLDVYRPVGPSTAPRPVVVFFFGGAWNMGDKSQGENLVFARHLAAHGMLVVVPNYRLFPTVYPGMLEDGAEAIAWTHRNIAHFGGDPRNIFLAGYSAGGYIATSLGTDERFILAQGVPRPAIRGVIGIAGAYSEWLLGHPAVRRIFEPAGSMRAASPGAHADAADPPLLLLHGLLDWLVPASNALDLASAVRQAGGRVRTEIFPLVEHVGIMMAAPGLPSLAPVIARSTEFIVEHLAPSAFASDTRPAVRTTQTR